jgi:hypothetical protein
VWGREVGMEGGGEAGGPYSLEFSNVVKVLMRYFLAG